MIIIDQPLISIITIVYNDKKGLSHTIESVLSQTYANIEFIVIDGGSTDGTLDVIKNYEDKIDYWVSEKDNGVYHAMNKGIKIAKGTWINFMNSGDKFVNENSLKDFMNSSEYRESLLLYGDRLFPDGTLKKAFDKKILKGGIIFGCHQSMFFNKDELAEKLIYDLKYKIYGDFDLVSKIYNIDPNRVTYVPLPVAVYEGGGISTQKKYINIKRKEKYQIVYKRFGLIGILTAIIYRIRKV